MGCSMCNTIDEIINYSDFHQLKNLFCAEYSLYLTFLKTLKTNLNSSIYDDKTPNNNQENGNINIDKKKEFNLIPRNWFENWEKRIEYIIHNNQYKSYDYDFDYNEFENKTKFYYDIMTNDLWSQINKNKEYNLNVKSKKKMGNICNNLIIFQHSNKENMIEIFFFKNEDDLFFTNLLFSFQKCQDIQKESFNILKLLKTSPIQEIFGNMHYDYSKKFIVKKKNIIIYNKTTKINENIKNFRKEQYEKMIKKSLIKESEETENKIVENMEDKKEKEKEEEDFPDINEHNKKYFNYRLNNINNRNNINREVSITRNDLSRSAFLNQNLINNKSNNISSIKIYKSKDMLEKNPKSNNEDIKEQNNNISPFRNYILSNNLYSDNNSKNKYINNNELSTILVNKNKGTNLYENIGYDYNESFLECVLYCLFNIKKLTNYILDNKENIKNVDNSFFSNFSKIIKFISNNNNKNKENKENEIYNLPNLRNNLIKKCPSYNFEKLLDLIIFQNFNNIISKIINLLHFELNKSNKKEELKYNISQNDISEENICLNEKEKKQKYDKFLQEYMENNKSIIFNLFYGIKEIKLICNNCNKLIYKYEGMNILEISKDKLYKFLSEKKENNINNKLNISIEDCLNYYKKEEKQNEKTLFNCVFCNEYQNYSIVNDICKYPEIFIIYFYNNNYLNNLDNKKNEQYLKIKIKQKIKLLNDEYILIGIISLKDIKYNKDENIYRYIAYLNIISNKKWIYFDDNEINDYNLDKNLDNINPVALFYQKNN